ncbi:hypothetical protein K501DRAFT_266585 [Backusella circina FSU 941]|nr:hypothetical protein K501DRAFT_266585 [Backusella circina FSU 941]
MYDVIAGLYLFINQKKNVSHNELMRRRGSHKSLFLLVTQRSPFESILRLFLLGSSHFQQNSLFRLLVGILTKIMSSYYFFLNKKKSPHMELKSNLFSVRFSTAPLESYDGKWAGK